ncbi:hypothetical protein Ciccas_002292 [Cichlidogyrus casuarinus]|uniref:Uncharacterized protein n=1 Tax=Cichlidogyrus casuarinus TaxID=1844966 RepID=A0ABD2QIM2_9PLAT
MTVLVILTSSCTNESSNLGLTSTTYFWQYNAQCKGPKAVRLIGEGADSPTCGTPPPYDPSNPPVRLSSALNSCPVAPFSLLAYPLVVFEDPVQKRHDLVHCSKLRRGDGNDVNPNLNRLRTMGDELERLNKQIAQQGEIIMSGQPGGVSGAVDQSSIAFQRQLTGANQATLHTVYAVL